MERSFPPMTRSSELRRHWGPKSRESLAHEPEINVRLMLNCSKRKPPLARACYSAPQVWSSNTKYRTLPRRPGRRYRRVCAPGRKSYPGILPRFPVPPSATCLARYSQPFDLHPLRIFRLHVFKDHELAVVPISDGYWPFHRNPEKSLKRN